MDFPVDIVLRDLEALPVTQEAIRRRVQGLSRYYEGIVGARIVVDRPHRRHARGNPYHITIQLSVPGEDIVVSHEPQIETQLRQERVERVTKTSEIHPEDRHLEVAVHAALDHARRRLEDRARRERGQVKTHEEPLRGRIARLLPGEDCGFIETTDRGEVYFHRNSVLDGKFEELAPGAAVSFVEEAGDEGPQASTVRVIG